MQNLSETKAMIDRKSIQNPSKIRPKSIQNRSRIHQKSYPNLSEIHPKSVQNGGKSTPGPFWMPKRVPIGAGTVPAGFTRSRGRHFARKWCPEGRFWDPPKTRNGSKIALLSKDRHRDPPKTPSGRGSGKNLKIMENPSNN